ncbi:MAG: chemotaxis response regulator protein-glutamate methylesterase [Hyphomicrobium sp.]|jgi:two-component system chemotaxis response regulator CheB|nr:chemotaxis response regulator protein-glutamate methylesterase [Hyphomicrobium sp.]
MKKIRVLVVDDSSTMRGLIISNVAGSADIEVVGEAENPIVAREAIKRLDPDVLTLDIEMPEMNGLDFLEKIMRLRPMPVIVVSTLTQRGAEATIRALELGAVDCIEKPRPGNENSLAELAVRVRMAARAQVQQRVAPAAAQPVITPVAADNKVVAIGASTGGVEALMTILRSFPEDCPPTAIVQHMPPGFTESLAARLDRQCRPQIRIATEGAIMTRGIVYLAPGGNAHLEIHGRRQLCCSLLPAPRVNGHCPSVDVLFGSLARSAGPKAVGVILTGMGNDGASGLLDIRKAGGRTFAQDEQSSVIYGMPRAAAQAGAVQTTLPLERIAAEVLQAKIKTAA